MPIEWIKRAFVRTSINPETGCWEYCGEIVHNGYGRIPVNGKNIRVHRLSYETFNGPIPADLLVCHKCDVRNCWNPDHLFLGTDQDNVDDMVAKGRSQFVNPRKGVPAAGSTITPEIIAEIKHMAASTNLGRRKIAEVLSLKPSTVGRIIKRQDGWSCV